MTNRLKTNNEESEYRQIHLRLPAADLVELELIAMDRGSVPIASLIREATKKFIKGEKEK